MSILEYLKTATNDNTQLSELVDSFEKMCKIPIESGEDMILFETGTFSFTGKSLFYFSLVRQFPNEDEEYYQLHLDIRYAPNNKNKVFSNAVWNEDIEGDFFDFIKRSDAYISLKNDVILEVSIYMDET